MTGQDLHPDQAATLKAQVGRQLHYLNRLVERMGRLGFPPTDPLYIAATRSREAAQDLYVACHYAGCKHGVGR